MRVLQLQFTSSLDERRADLDGITNMIFERVRNWQFTVCQSDVLDMEWLQTQEAQVDIAHDDCVMIIRTTTHIGRIIGTLRGASAEAFEVLEPGKAYVLEGATKILD